MTMLYLTFLVMVSTVRASNCPGSCTCSEFSRYELQQPEKLFASVVCNTGDNITQHLPKHTYNLQLVNVHLGLRDFFEELGKSFYCLPYLTNLQISNCDLFNVTNVHFDTDHLRTLKFIQCRISLVPTVNVTSLKVLDLSDNNIEVIRLNPFRTLSSLEVLNLSANAIEVLFPRVFTGLSNLKCLDLSDNNLTVLNNNVLVPVVNLQHLNLSNNRLEVLNEACFSSLLHLQQLDVSWNRLARVLPGSLELPSLARLLLAGNPGLGLSRKPTLLVGTGRKLQTVDASRTGLKQVPAALTHSIRTLRLAGNSIRSVNCGDLDSYPLLQLLDFISNNLEYIEDDALGRLDSLCVLYLSDNKLKSIPRSLPEKLKVLHLENNEIEQVQLNDLQGLRQIEVLLLNNNKIHSVEASAFSQLGSLVTLDFSKNPILTLPAGILSGPVRLQVLRLSGLAVVPQVKEVAFPLTAPEHLIILDLSNSPGLAHQLLADTAALAAARELQELNLSNTGLENIRSDLLHFLQQLRVLHLRDNFINCTDLQWLGFWMRKQDEPEYREIMCASPPDLWGTPLIDLQETESAVLIGTNESGITETESGKAELNDTDQIMKPYASTLITTDAEKFQSEIFEIITVNPKKKLAALSNDLKNLSGNNIDTENPFIKHRNRNTNTTESLQENSTYYANEIIDINVTIPTAQMSLYGDNNNNKTELAHPGMLILVIGILATTVVLAMLTRRFTKKRNSRRLSEIEVSSISGVTELW